mgnify:CR=1 FL=1
MNNLFAFCVFVWIAGQVLSMAMSGRSGLATTSLTANLSATATSMTVQGTDGFLDADYVIIENERIRYTNRGSTTFTGLTRGSYDSTASAHASTTVVYNETTGLVNQLVGFNIVQTFANDGFFKGVAKFFTSFDNLAVSVANMLAWNYAFLEGNAVYLKYFLFYPISAAMILELLNRVFSRRK